MMALQFAGQSTAVALNRAKQVRLFFSVSKGHHCHSVDHAASNDRKSGDRWSVLGRTDFQCYWRYGMFCNHVAYNLAKAERRKLLFAVTEKIDNMAKKEIDNQRDTDYNEFISGV